MRGMIYEVVKYRFTTEEVCNREVRVRYISTNLNFADIMTKALSIGAEEAQGGGRCDYQ